MVLVLAVEAFLGVDLAYAGLACVLAGHVHEEAIVDHFEDCR